LQTYETKLIYLVGGLVLYVEIASLLSQ